MEYLVHLTIKSNKPLTQDDIVQMLARFMEQLDDSDTIDVEYSYHEEV